MNHKTLGENRKAYHLYFVEDKLECGIALVGTEVKSLRGGQFSFSDSYAQVENNELFLINFHINPFFKGTTNNHSPLRKRKLLAHKNEIKKLARATNEKGFTLIPLQLYLKNGRVKVLIGVCKGKQQHDKRQSIKEKDLRRESERSLKGN